MVVLLTVTVEQQTGLADPREAIRYRTANEPRNETSVVRAEISGVTIALVIAVALVTGAVLAIAVALVIAAIVAALVIVVESVTVAVLAIAVVLETVAIAVASAIVVESVIVEVWVIEVVPATAAIAAVFQTGVAVSAIVAVIAVPELVIEAAPDRSTTVQVATVWVIAVAVAEEVVAASAVAQEVSAEPVRDKAVVAVLPA